MKFTNILVTISLALSIVSFVFAVTPFEWKYKVHMWVVNDDTSSYVNTITECEYNLMKENEKLRGGL